jgi:hypothetical protein
MRHIRTALAVIAMAITATVTMATGAGASDSHTGATETRAGVERIALADGTTLLRGVTSQAQLAAACTAFCGYDNSAGYGLEWRCGRADIPANWVGSGWWENRLPGTNDRVQMYGSNNRPSYKTPHSPYSDYSANWKPVYWMLVCVA